MLSTLFRDDTSDEVSANRIKESFFHRVVWLPGIQGVPAIRFSVVFVKKLNSFVFNCILCENGYWTFRSQVCIDLRIMLCTSVRFIRTDNVLVYYHISP